MTSYLLKSPCLLSLRIHVLSMLAIKARVISEFFSLPRQYIGKKTAEDSAETFVYYVSNGFGIPQHFAKGSDLVF